MTVRLLARASACIAALALLAAFAQAPEDEDDGPDEEASGAPVVVDIAGPCTVSLDERKTPCQGVAYMAFPSTGRIDFTALTEAAGWAFSGENDGQLDGRYVLMVDSVVSPSAGRLEAEGECDMELTDDRRTVKSLACAAMTSEGALSLEASGAVTVKADTLPDDEDDGDEEGEDDEGDEGGGGGIG